MKRHRPRSPGRAPLYAMLPVLPSLTACAGPASPVEAHDVWITHPAPVSSAVRSRAPEPERRRARPPPREGRQPHHFWYLSGGEIAERREWVRVGEGTWEERYPSGAVIRFREVGRFDEGGRVGVLVRRLPDGGLDVLIPDVGAEGWPQRRVAPDGEWHDLGPMHLIE